MTHPSPANRLIRETSPYLLQHAHNPVDWYPWCDEAFDEARRRDCPVLLSVGYSACHWCHVMERESFADARVAALMNAEFVNVKVDREERPDVDQVYMDVVQALTGRGGWPMTVFMTPDRHPFYAGTYFPPEDRYGMPSFTTVLQAVARAWREQRTDLAEQGAALVEHAARAAAAVSEQEPAPVTAAGLDTATARLVDDADTRNGGFGDAPKFPQSMALDFALRWSVRRGFGRPLAMVTGALDGMAAGGILDHLGGGFHRYSTDARWLVPHFEKMLYDNALLAQTYLRAFVATERVEYRDVAERTLDYVRREMTDPAGGFYSSQDADSEGEEGRFYVWTAAEIAEVLGAEDAAAFGRTYGVTPQGNWEGRNVLNLPDGIGSPDAHGPQAAAARQRLLEARGKRVAPGRDDKVIAAWNGMMLATFAEAARVLNRVDYLQTAVNSAQFLLRELVVDGVVMRTGRSVPHDVPPGIEHALHRSSAFRLAPIRGFLDDYACLADGLLALYAACHERQWLEAARDLADALLERFYDPAGGGFHVTETGAPGGTPIRPREVTDNPPPAGSSVAVDVLLRLALYTGESRYRDVAERHLGTLAETMVRHPLAFGRALLAACAWLNPTVEVAVVGEAGDPSTEALLDVTRRVSWPDVVTAWGAPGGDGAAYLPMLADRPAVQGRPAAYVCVDRVCGLPVTEPDALRDKIARALGLAPRSGD